MNNTLQGRRGSLDSCRNISSFVADAVNRGGVRLPTSSVMLVVHIPD
jgi:hypothetical protein